MKIIGYLFVCVLLYGSAATAQSNLMLLLNPYPNQEKVMFNTESTVVGKADEKITGNDFGQFEQTLALRAALIQNEERELYFISDSHLVDLDTSGVFSQSGVPLPDELYNVGAGLLYRETVHTDWRIGGQLRIGSSSDKLFHSSKEMYANGFGFLQIPHRETTSWIAILAVNTNLEIPVFPGFAYAFRLTKQSLAVVGFPFMGASGKLTEKLGFQLFYWPVRNANAHLSYQVTEYFRPRVGFRWRGQYFSRPDRVDSDDRIVLQDKRFFVGSLFDITPEVALDVQGGYLFDRTIGEGEDFGDQNDNKIRIDSTWYASLELRVVF